MKKILLLFISSLIISKLQAQQFEISAGAYSGLFHYDGHGSTPVSFIYEGSPTDKQNYTYNPYGSKNGLSYGGDVQVQYVSVSGFISGLQAGYDVLRSKTDLNNYYPIIITILYNINNPSNIPSYQNPVNVKGQTYLQDEDINISPYIGYRFRVKKIKIDVMPGAELGFNINSYDKGKATDSNGNTYQTNLKLANAPPDIRLRFGIAASLNRFGLTVSYAKGLTNLYKNTNGNGNNIAHSELIRFGLSYRIF